MTGGESRKTDTRQALMDAALDVFVQRGFARATTREIAQTAGVAEGTIYRHFTDKHALFQAVFFSVAGAMIDEFRRIPERAGQGTLRENLEYLFGLIAAQQKRLSPLMASMWADPEVASGFHEQIREQGLAGFELDGPVMVVAEYIRAEQAKGRIRDDVDAEEAATVVVAVPFARGVQQTLDARFPAPRAFPAPAKSAIDILARGLAPSAGGAGD